VGYIEEDNNALYIPTLPLNAILRESEKRETKERVLLHRDTIGHKNIYIFEK